MKLRTRYHETMVYVANRPLQYAITRLMRFQAVAYLPGVKTYFINNPMLAKAILADVENFSSSHTGSIGELASSIMGSDSKALFNMHGAEHHDLKFKLLDIFQPKYIDAMVAEALDLEISQLVEQIQAKKPVDLALFIKRCTARVTCHMLGISATTPDFEKLLFKVAKLSDDLTSMISVSSSKLSAQETRKGQAIYREFSALIKKYYDQDDHPSSSVIAKLKERNFDFDTAKALLVTLIMAGTETVSSALPRIVSIFIEEELWSGLAAEPEKLELAINEGLRFTSPSPLVLHSVVKDNTTGGHSFKGNRRALVMLVNILRDDRYYPNAYTIDFDRKPSDTYRNFWFGAGPHFCLGSELAKKELRTIIGTLLKLSSNPVILRRRYASHTSFPGYSMLLVDFSN